jgi:hypothetical protein
MHAHPCGTGTAQVVPRRGRNFLDLRVFANLLAAPALLHNGKMTLWCRHKDATSSRHLLWLPACLIAALIAARITQTRADDFVTIEVVGEIDQKCRLNALPASIELGKISKSGTQFIPFHIDCNTPFEYSVRSRDGAFKNPEVTAASIGFVGQIPYQLDLRIPTDGGLILALCDSVNLSGLSPSCGHGNSGSSIAIGQIASLTLSWAVGAELVAGTYSDVVTLTFRPRL